jgi:hypothetical protein
VINVRISLSLLIKDHHEKCIENGSESLVSTNSDLKKIVVLLLRDVKNVTENLNGIISGKVDAIEEDQPIKE